MTILDEILAGIAAALLITVGVLLVMNANLRADLATARANASTLAGANADLKNDTDRQNRALAALKAESDARALAAAQAIKAAAVQGKRFVTEASAIAADPVSGDECVSAKKILRDYLEHTQ